jgi:hypothetical protein
MDNFQENIWWFYFSFFELSSGEEELDADLLKMKKSN